MTHEITAYAFTRHTWRPGQPVEVIDGELGRVMIGMEDCTESEIREYFDEHGYTELPGMSGHANSIVQWTRHTNGVKTTWSVAFA